MTTAHYELFEGNRGFNFDSDSFWGNSIYIVVFRNHLTGLRSDIGHVGLTDEFNRRAIGLTLNQWWYTFVGNVLGFAGQVAPPPAGATFAYEWPGGSFTHHYMWKLGYDGQDWGPTQDAKVVSTAIRHGNFDYVSNTLVWDASNPNHTIPNSLYLSAKPAFFGANTWPWVDAVGATKVYTLPAKARFDALGLSKISAPKSKR
jgi:hypothetical protein